MFNAHTKSFLLLLAIPVTVLALSACTAEDRAMNLAPGKYESKQSSTDASGTTVERESSTEVEVEDGKKKATIESETTKDPKGLFNKKTLSKSKKVIEEEDNQ